MAATEETSKPKQRPIVRLGILLISHSLLVSVVCGIGGVVALLLLPVLAKNTYISENALMPGSANPTISSQDVAEANKLVKDIVDLSVNSHDAGIGLQGLVAEYISDLGAEVGYQRFYPHSTQFHPLHFFSLPDTGAADGHDNCSSHGINIVGIVRAPRGDGKEAIVLVTPYNSTNPSMSDALSVGLTFSVFSLLTRVTWLAKDIVWLLADSRYGEYAAVAAWLRDYQMPVFNGFTTIDPDTCPSDTKPHGLNMKVTEGKITDSFRRAGTMAAALVVKVVSGSEPFEDTLSLYAEASNGQMPNLDLINIVNYLAVHRQGLRVKVKKFMSMLESEWLFFLGEVIELLGAIAKRLNPEWKFGIPAAEYVDGTATLASSLYHQALGVPTGSHGAFGDYQIDAVTLEFSPKVYSVSKGRQKEFLLRGGRLIEGVIRSVNNLLEKFHQSFFLYLLTSPSRFVSVGVYMIPFALLVAPLPVMAASLYARANNLESSTASARASSSGVDKFNVTPRSLIWLNAAKKVLVIHFWGATVSLLPYFVCQLPLDTPTMRLAVWSMVSVVSLLLLHLVLGSRQKGEWLVLKSVTLSAVFIGLGLMSVVNFATAEFGALLLVPMCLMVYPLKVDLQTRSLSKFARAVCNMVLAFVGFPPAVFFILKGGVDGFHGISLGDFWNWVESLWVWNSATYLYISTIHLPCWLLCLNILLTR